MPRKLLLLTLVCFTAATLLAIGCGDKDEPTKKKDDESKAPQAKKEPPKTEPPKTEPPKTEPPKTEPPKTEPPKTEPPKTEPPKTEPPKTEPPKTEPPKTEPAAGKKFPGMWADAKVGTMVKIKIVASKGTKTDEVIKCDKDTVTIRTTMAMPNVPAGILKPTEKTVNRFETVDPVTGKVPGNVKVKKLPDQTITIAGKDYKCEVYETVMAAGGRQITSRTYMCKEVPGWIVRTESDAMGKMAVSMEVVEFKK